MEAPGTPSRCPLTRRLVLIARGAWSCPGRVVCPEQSWVSAERLRLSPRRSLLCPCLVGVRCCRRRSRSDVPLVLSVSPVVLVVQFSSLQSLSALLAVLYRPPALASPRRHEPPAPASRSYRHLLHLRPAPRREAPVHRRGQPEPCFTIPLFPPLTSLPQIGFGNWGSVWLCRPKPDPPSSSGAPPKPNDNKIAVKLVHRSKTSTTAARVRSLYVSCSLSYAHPSNTVPS